MIAEDAGMSVVEEFLEIATKMGFGYRHSTGDIARLTTDEIEFTDGTSVESQISMVLPDWVPQCLGRRDQPAAVLDPVGSLSITTTSGSLSGRAMGPVTGTRA